MIQKLNTVVNSHNWEENMSLEVEQLNPVRWKVSSALKKNILLDYSHWPLLNWRSIMVLLDIPSWPKEVDSLRMLIYWSVTLALFEMNDRLLWRFFSQKMLRSFQVGQCLSTKIIRAG